jgi:hypothetical protein
MHTTYPRQLYQQPLLLHPSRESCDPSHDLVVTHTGVSFDDEEEKQYFGYVTAEDEKYFKCVLSTQDVIIIRHPFIHTYEEMICVGEPAPARRIQA